MAAFTYTGSVTLPADKAFTTPETITGTVIFEGIENSFPFTGIIPATTPVTPNVAVLTATITAGPGQTLPALPIKVVKAAGNFLAGPNGGVTEISILGLTVGPAVTISSAAISSVSISSVLSPASSSTERASSSIRGTESVRAASSPLATTSDGTRTTLPSGTDTPQREQESYGAGHLAGTAVGCLIGGALLATAVLLFFMRRRRRNRNDLSEPVREKSALSGHGRAVQVAGSKAWEGHLPQSESDGTIRAMAERTLDQIEMHVENFYKDAANVHLGPDVQSKITELDSRHLSGPILSLLPQSKRPTVLIKHCIGNLVISKIAAAEATTHSFLPKDFHGFESSSTAQRKPGFTQALSSWRVLTAYLSAEPEHDQTYQDQRDQSIAAAAQQVCQAFGPWARGTDTERGRSQNLVGIMKRASELGIILFSQPSTFEWQWQQQQQQQRHGQGREVPVSHDSTKMVVLPGLYKTSDQGAVEIVPPMCVVEPRFGAF